MNSIQKDAEAFAEVICKTKFKENILAFGHFLLRGKEGVNNDLSYFKGADDLIRGRLNYTYKINDGDLELSLQLWLNVNNHYKFRAITRINNEIGYVFSVNLTTQKESENIIYLLNKIKFSEKYEGDIKIAKAYLISILDEDLRLAKTHLKYGMVGFTREGKRISNFEFR